MPISRNVSGRSFVYAFSITDLMRVHYISRINTIGRECSKAHTVKVAGILSYMASPDQGLAWDAGKVGAITTNLPFFYYGHSFAQAVRCYSRDKSTDACTDYHHVIIVFSGHCVPSRAFGAHTILFFSSFKDKRKYEVCQQSPPQISALFLDTADNEKEHAKMFFKLLQGGETEIIASYPAGVISDTAANLKAAADWRKI